MNKPKLFRHLLLSLLTIIASSCSAIQWGIEKDFDYEFDNNKKIHNGDVVDIQINGLNPEHIKLTFKNREKGALLLIPEESYFTGPDGEPHKLLSKRPKKSVQRYRQPAVRFDRFKTSTRKLYFEDPDAVFSLYYKSKYYNSHVKDRLYRTPSSLVGKKFNVRLAFRDSNDKKYFENLVFILKPTKKFVRKHREPIPYGRRGTFQQTFWNTDDNR